MIKFYYSLAPNPLKVALFLEEAGLEYEAIPVDTRKGEQFAPAFAAVNPNNKVPAIVDGEAAVFDSGAILLYLGEKTGKFVPPAGDKARGELLSWLMFAATGIGPYSGQAVHFRHYAPEPKEYGVTRYLYEVKRHYGVLDARLADREWMLGSAYSIVDMAVWGWARMLPFILGETNKDMTVWSEFPHVKRLMDAINARPAATRAEAIRDRHSFKAEFDAEAKAFMFRHIKETAA
ncbi:glutathione S-transferase family protein [Acidisphaera sp. L21]|uniref:glutathione S-transferase family protein n=1 Tax=Acidisphaera sp. L21 TaxID=1641851 RepID=UPI00131B2E84|nr:glutathione S-transferase N-terminal domain-containing protein [Acidisphaera sp. L21]